MIHIFLWAFLQSGPITRTEYVSDVLAGSRPDMALAVKTEDINKYRVVIGVRFVW